MFVGGDCDDSPMTPDGTTPLTRSAKFTAMPRSPADGNDNTGNHTMTVHSHLSSISKRDKENSPESSISPVSKAASFLRTDLGPTHNPFVSRARAQVNITFNEGQKKSKSSAAAFKATEVYLQRAQTKEPGFNIRL